MSEINKVIDSSEKILWSGKPAFLPFVFNLAGLTSFIFGIFWTVITSFIVLGPIILSPQLSGGHFPWYIFAIPHIYIGPFLMFGTPIYKALVFNSTNYAITNKRVIIEKGVIGRDFDSIDYDQITNVSVNVDLFDKIFNQNTGSILIQTASAFKPTKNGMVAAPYELDSVKDPYTVFKNLKQSSFDVKTDINYPNAMRPSGNPGYNTELLNNPFDNQIASEKP